MDIIAQQIASPECPFHEVTHSIPGMSWPEYSALVDSIAQVGLLEPILLDDKGEKIIDGRHRYLACQNLEIEPKYRIWDGVGDLKSLVTALNVRRKHFNQSQTAMIARNAIPLLHKQASGEPEGERGKYLYTRKAIKEAAASAGASETDVRHAIFLGKRGAPELEAAVFSGLVSVSAAALVAANHTKKEQAKIAVGGKSAVADAVKTILNRQPSGKQASDLLPSFGPKNSKPVVTNEQQALWLEKKRKQCQDEGRDLDLAETISEMLGAEVVDI